MICLDALDLLNSLGEAHRKIQQNVTLVGSGGGAGEVANMGRRSGGPVYDDVEGEEEAAEGIEPPYLSIISDFFYVSCYVRRFDKTMVAYREGI
jgi:hypothetical protein